MQSAQLSREEYIEQAYFFRVYRERLHDNIPSQEILSTVYEEILATTKLTMAIEFLHGEIQLTGRISDGMYRLAHYFSPFQSFVMSKAEEDKARFDQSTALHILEHEAQYKSKEPTQAGLFTYQFECVSRNRLGYDRGLEAIAADPAFDEPWREWIGKIKHSLGVIELSEMIYRRSEHYVQQYRRKSGQDDFQPQWAVLFGTQEGRIARANKGRDPLYMFAALQRQLDYPTVPYRKPRPDQPLIHPAVETRLKRIEDRLKLLEAENKGGIDLSEFTVKPPDWNRIDDVEPPK